MRVTFIRVRVDCGCCGSIRNADYRFNKGLHFVVLWGCCGIHRVQELPLEYGLLKYIPRIELKGHTHSR